MSRKPKPPPEGPNNAYLMSFGDTMTTLLAFFIVLNSLADEQTGANLHAGTGSFMRAVKGMGLAGSFGGKGTSRAVNFQGGSPLYITEDEDPQASNQSLGPDENANKLRVLDREADQLERLLEDLDRRFASTERIETSAEVVIDLFQPLSREGPLLSGAYRQAVLQVASRAIDPDFRVEFTVWATTPNPTAVRRAARQAAQIQQEFYSLLRLGPEHQRRVTATARTWFDSKAKRPIVSLTIRKR